MNRRDFSAALSGGGAVSALIPAARSMPPGSPQLGDQGSGQQPPVANRLPRTAAEAAVNVTPENESYAPLDLRRYGADATGAKASDLAMVNAIAVCGASGGIVSAPAGLYTFAGQISLAGKRSIIIAGEGAATGGAQAATCFTYTGAGDRVFINMNSAVGCQLRGLQITHRDSHYTGTYIKCSNAGASDPAFCALLDCVLGSSAGPGNVHLDLDKCIQFTAERCNFVYGNPSVRGRSTRGYSNVIRFRDCQWAACHSAPIRSGGQSWTFEGCTFEGLVSGAAGALLSGDSAGAFNGIAIVGCWFGDASAAGTWIDIYGNGVQASGNYISGNVRGAIGVALHRSVGVQFAGNLLDQLLVGFDFAEGPCRDIVVHGNIANLVTTGFRNAENVPTGSLVWGPNYGLGAPGSPHQRLGADGYCADAQSGMLRQWGAAPISGAAVSHSISFPIKFPSQCFNVVATLSAGSHSGSACISRLSAAGFDAAVQGTADGATLYWQALGA